MKSISYDQLIKRSNYTFEFNEINDVHLQDVAVIGLGLRFPQADHLEQYWENIVNGLDCIIDLPKTRQNDLEQFFENTGRNLDHIRYLNGAFLDEIDQFDYEFFKLTPKEASLMSPLQRVLLETAWKAIEDAGYGNGKINGSNTAVVVGIIGDVEGYKYKEMIEQVDPSLLSIATSGNLTSMSAGRISYTFNLKGPSIVIDTACSSSLVTIDMACKALRRGECEMALTGGIKINIQPIDNQYYKIGIESSDTITRAFDHYADGSGIGEGAGVLLLKPLYLAKRDNDQIYCVIKGSAVNQDGASMGITAPNPQSQANVMIKAWEDARIHPETLSYIETHGTATPLGDTIEMDGLTQAFRKYTDKQQFCAIGSVKSNIGHLYEAAGVAGMIKAIAALKYKTIPPTIHFNEPNRKIDFHRSPVYVNTRARQWKISTGPRRLGISSFGLSGTNCHVVIEEAPVRENKEGSENRTKVSVPAYLLEKKRCWLSLPDRKVTRQHEQLDQSDQVLAKETYVELLKPLTSVILFGRENEQYSPMEVKIANLWSQVLGFEQLDVDDHFFELGGNSLTGLKIINLFKAQLNIKIEVNDLLNHVTIAKLALFIESKQNLDQSEQIQEIITPLPSQHDYPTSSSQKRMYVVYQMDQENVSANILYALKMEGNVQVVKLNSVIRSLILQHEALRTSVCMIDGQLRQMIHEQVDFCIEELDLELDLLDELNSIDECKMNQIINGWRKPFKIEQPLLFRVGLIKTSTDKFILVFDFHHMIMDGASVIIMMKQFVKLYDGGQLQPLNVQFKEFAHLESSQLVKGSFEQHEGYWLSQFQKEIPIQLFPTDFDYPSVRSSIGRTERVWLDEQLVEQLAYFSKKSGTTMYMIMMCAYHMLQSKYMNQEDMIVGATFINRTHEQFEQVVGMFTNTVAIRSYPQKKLTLIEFLNQMKAIILQAFTYQDYPFDELITKLNLKRSTNRHPLFDTMFNYLNVKGIEFAVSDFTAKIIPVEVELAQFDLCLEVMENGGEILLNLTYRTDLFTRETILRIQSDYIHVLKILTQCPEMTIKQLTLPSVHVEKNDNETLNELDVSFDF